MQVPQNRLAELREARGEQRYHLSAVVERDPATISRWERGLIAIPDDAKLKLAAHYKVSVAHLMGWDAVPEPTTGEAA